MRQISVTFDRTALCITIVKREICEKLLIGGKMQNSCTGKKLIQLYRTSSVAEDPMGSLIKV